MKITKQLYYLFVIILFYTIDVKAQIKQHSVFLVSNLVDVKNITLFEQRIKNIFSKCDNPYTLLVNGDIVSENFDKNFQSDSIRLNSLFSIISKNCNGKIIILPGERDWDNNGKNGLKNIKLLEKLIKSFKIPNLVWANKKGCPGPNLIELQENLLLIAINTQWWNHPFQVPGPIDGKCKIATTDDFKEELEDIINENPNKNIIVAGHYPIFSNGEFGGHQPIYKHIFPLTDINSSLYIPLPLLGSYYTSFRENIGTATDISNEKFEEFRQLLEDILAQYQSLVYMSGHDKTQQIVERFENFFINSGAPESASHAVNIKGSRLQNNHPGIIEVIYNPNGQVLTTFHKFYQNSDKIEKFNNILLESTCNKSESFFPLNFQYEPCKEIPKPDTKMQKKYNEKISVIAGKEYEAGSVKRFFFGDHYRNDWIEPVKVPYLDLDTTKGGLTVIKRGGGRQTLSLKFMGNDGQRYVFRSVNKDPIKALDYDLRETGIARIVKDQTSTQHPYGALAVDILLNELDIIHAHPKLYVLPNDPKLGPFQNEFGNMLGMLEESPKNPKGNETGYRGSSSVLRSNKLFRKLYNNNKHRVNSDEFIRARVFDILVGDWGKHEDNWKWLGFKENDKTIYRPMPRDRDHVFSRWDGVFPWITDREWAKSSGENFDYEIVGLRSLMNQARHLDRFVAADKERKDWIREAKFIQEKITDEIIHKAVKNMPEETYPLSGKEIETKLIARRNDLLKYASDYYEMIAREVDIVGSNKDEIFEIIYNKDGSLLVNGLNKKKDYQFYERTFYPTETDEIRLYGLDGNDIFLVKGKTDNSICVRIIGGKGKDEIINNSEVKNELFVYDKGKKTTIKGFGNTKRKYPYNESLYNYDRTRFAYDTYLPLPYISYNADDGIILNAGVQFTFHSWTKEKYSSKHKLQLGVSLEGSFGFEYNSRFRQIINDWDVEFSFHYDNPLRYTYFYGFGNESVKNDNLPDEYYRNRYSSRGGYIGVVKDFWKRSNFSVGISYNNNERQEKIKNTILEKTNFIGQDKVNLIEATAKLNFDFRDNPTLPRSGTSFTAEYNNGFITNLDYSNYGKLFLKAEGYLSKEKFIPFTLGIITGGGKSFGKIPFYNKLTLGQDNHLKGYTKNRFTGSSIAFLKAAMRISLFGVDGPLLPMNIGLLSFYNTGRVFENNENSSKWHTGYGFGMIIVPVRKEFTLYTTVSFSEEESMLFEFGLGSGL